MKRWPPKTVDSLIDKSYDSLQSIDMKQKKVVKIKREIYRRVNAIVINFIFDSSDEI
ncbi:MAG: hypothetical protein GYA50_00080 [Eubacteriaceae bacterium]|nr:hypothetical protein [Eubacteriaceae bacterium]